MKTAALFLGAFVAISTFAQTPPAGTVSQPATSTSTNEFAGLNVTNRTGETFSGEEIRNQLSELRRAVLQATPVVSAVTETYSNTLAAAKPSVANSVAGVLGGLLNRTNNNTTTQSGSTASNLLGGILSGVLGGATNNVAGGNQAEFRDVVALQEHLQAIEPILDRLGVTTNAAAPFGIGGTSTNSPSETGKGQRQE